MPHIVICYGLARTKVTHEQKINSCLKTKRPDIFHQLPTKLYACRKIPVKFHLIPKVLETLRTERVTNARFYCTIRFVLSLTASLLQLGTPWYHQFRSLSHFRRATLPHMARHAYYPARTIFLPIWYFQMKRTVIPLLFYAYPRTSQNPPYSCLVSLEQTPASIILQIII